MAGFPKLGGIILLGLLSASCNRAAVLVVSDPYINIVENPQWGPSSRCFSVQLRLRGYKVEQEIADTANPLPKLLGLRSSASDILVLSPWNSAFPANFNVDADRIYVFGNPRIPADINPTVQLIQIVGDRSQAVRKLGTIAGRMALEERKGAVALLREGGDFRDLLQEGYREAGGEAYPLRVFNTVNEDYQEASDNCSVLVLLSGPSNLEALALSADASTPVLSEFISNSNAWRQRIVASIEDDPKKRDRVLLESISSKEPESVENYDMRVVKGILFKKYRR